MNKIDNINVILERIESARKTAGTENVRLIAVSKTRTADEVKSVFGCGLKDFGENRIQEAVPKIKSLGIDAVWHLIGHLQSNKAAKAAQYFDYVHSLDKIETAEKLGKSASGFGRVIKSLIQVNTSNEQNKNGIDPSEVLNFAEKLAGIEGLEPVGLMTIGPLMGSEDDNKRSFAMLRNILTKIQKSFPLYRELSMGMSGDFETAILEGATMVRIGTAIFGSRNYI
ncbi:MAG: YggS family pyridoxal phosphate-dependent enzyme [Spirochaetes bacterium]|nr:YggS family pyridoxal phosphate-dependent enzyme [Spirochaetota bacterium]